MTKIVKPRVKMTPHEMYRYVNRAVATGLAGNEKAAIAELAEFSGYREATVHQYYHRYGRMVKYALGDRFYRKPGGSFIQRVLKFFRKK